jgi:hypothetical protein
MENKTVPPAVPHAPKDERAAWITPAIVDYDIEEATRSDFAGAGIDGLFPNQAYS